MINPHEHVIKRLNLEIAESAVLNKLNSLMETMSENSVNEAKIALDSFRSCVDNETSKLVIFEAEFNFLVLQHKALEKLKNELNLDSITNLINEHPEEFNKAAAEARGLFGNYKTNKIETEEIEPDIISEIAEIFRKNLIVNN